MFVWHYRQKIFKVNFRWSTNKGFIKKLRIQTN